MQWFEAICCVILATDGMDLLQTWVMELLGQTPRHLLAPCSAEFLLQQLPFSLASFRVPLFIYNLNSMAAWFTLRLLVYSQKNCL